MSRPAKPRSELDTSEWASPEEYNALIRSLRLQDIRMVSGSFHSDERSTGRKASIAAEIESTARFESVDDGFIAFIRLVLVAIHKGSKSPAFRIDAEFSLTYKTGITVTQELFRPFVHLNLPVQAWPYFREFVQSATARMEWPPLALPSLHSTGASLDLTSGVVDVQVEDPA